MERDIAVGDFGNLNEVVGDAVEVREEQEVSRLRFKREVLLLHYPGLFVVAFLLLDDLRVGRAGDVRMHVHDVVACDVVRRQVAEFVRVVRAVVVRR